MLVRSTTSTGSLSAGSGTNLRLPSLERQAAPLQQHPAAFEVEPDRALDGSEALLDGVLVEAREDALDGRGPDLVATDQLEQLVVGGVPHRLDEALGVDAGEERGGLLGGCPQ